MAWRFFRSCLVLIYPLASLVLTSGACSGAASKSLCTSGTCNSTQGLPCIGCSHKWGFDVFQWARASPEERPESPGAAWPPPITSPCPPEDCRTTPVTVLMRAQGGRSPAATGTQIIAVIQAAAHVLHICCNITGNHVSYLGTSQADPNEALNATAIALSIDSPAAQTTRAMSQLQAAQTDGTLKAYAQDVGLTGNWTLTLHHGQTQQATSGIANHLSSRALIGCASGAAIAVALGVLAVLKLKAKTRKRVRWDFAGYRPLCNSAC
ncbi:hypothetical protein WJX73_006427 [Symbiochloris irregularis]|uniref:Uncharacterized protein n=1 Tax=Symbiochloris irregularis TaxID=706552 RepID=A0AAW1NPF5_9CHLO